MRSELSEFSYGFAVTAEIRDHLHDFIVAAPVMPSLLEEAQQGWDVKVPLMAFPLFLQFKVAHAMVQRTAGQWHYYNQAYFRIALHRRAGSHQHNTLCTLAAAEPHVYYVAPRFHELDQFNAHYLSQSVVHESAWIPVAQLPSIADNDQHYITYRTGYDVRFWSPEYLPVEGAYDGKGWLDLVTRTWESERRLITAEYLVQIQNKLLSVLRETHWRSVPEFPLTEQQASLPGLLRDITYLSRTFLAAEFILIGKPAGS